MPVKTQYLPEFNRLKKLVGQVHTVLTEYLRSLTGREHTQCEAQSATRLVRFPCT